MCVCNQITSTKWSVTLSTLKRHAFCLSECLLNACEMNKIISAKCKKKVYYTPVPNWERCREKKSVCRSEKKWELLYMELHNWFCVQQQITRFCWKEATNTVLLSMSIDLFLYFKSRFRFGFCVLAKWKRIAPIWPIWRKRQTGKLAFFLRRNRNFHSNRKCFS